MGKNNKKVSLINLISVVISIVLIWILGLLFMEYNTSLKIVSDEFGYWSAVAWMTGADWSEVASINPYYSYGYGLILSLVMWLPISIIAKYKLAILLNIVMLSAVYLIIYYLLNEKRVFDKSYINALVALTVTLYTGNLVHVQYTMTETLLLLCFWLFILLLHSLSKKYSFYKITLGAVLLIYTYTVHQRMLGVVFAGVVCLLYIEIRNKRYRNALIFLIVTLALFCGAECVKNIYKDAYLTNHYVSAPNNNDYSGQVSKLGMLVSVEGMLQFLISVLGKIYYVMTSTYFLAGVAVYRIIKDIVTYVKNKKIPSDGIVQAFVLLTVITTIGISALFLIHYSGRFDVLIYGRYSEFFIGALVLIGFTSLLRMKTVDWKMHLALGVLYLVATIVVDMEVPRDVSNISSINASAIYNALYVYDKDFYMMGLTTVAMYIIIVLLAYLFHTKGQKTAMIAICLLLSVNWTVSYLVDYQIGVLEPWGIGTCTAEETIADDIRDAGIEQCLYYYVPDGPGIDYLQFLLEDVTIHCIFDETELETLPEDAYLVTGFNRTLEETDALDDFELVTESIYLQVWKQAH